MVFYYKNNGLQAGWNTVRESHSWLSSSLSYKYLLNTHDSLRPLLGPEGVKWIIQGFCLQRHLIQGRTSMSANNHSSTVTYIHCRYGSNMEEWLALGQHHRGSFMSTYFRVSTILSALLWVRSMSQESLLQATEANSGWLLRKGVLFERCIAVSLENQVRDSFWEQYMKSWCATGSNEK